MSKPYSGACVLFCGHDATFIADIWTVGNVNVVVGNAPIEKSLSYGNKKGVPTHHLIDFPKPGYWSKSSAVFVVPTNQVKELI